MEVYFTQIVFNTMGNTIAYYKQVEDLFDTFEHFCHLMEDIDINRKLLKAFWWHSQFNHEHKFINTQDHESSSSN